MKSCLFVGVDTHKNSHTAAVLDGYFDVSATINGKGKNPVSRAYFLKKISEGKTKKRPLPVW